MIRLDDDVLAAVKQLAAASSRCINEISAICRRSDVALHLAIAASVAVGCIIQESVCECDDCQDAVDELTDVLLTFVKFAQLNAPEGSIQ